MDRSAEEVAKSHLEAVESGDPGAMAADYAADAILERAGDRYVGRAAIEAYFATVPERLGDAAVVFDSFRVSGNVVTFSWHLEGGEVNASGIDTCRISGGAILHQTVRLTSSDF